MFTFSDSLGSFFPAIPCRLYNFPPSVIQLPTLIFSVLLLFLTSRKCESGFTIFAINIERVRFVQVKDCKWTKYGTWCRCIRYDSNRLSENHYSGNVPVGPRHSHSPFICHVCSDTIRSNRFLQTWGKVPEQVFVCIDSAHRLSTSRVRQLAHLQHYIYDPELMGVNVKTKI